MKDLLRFQIDELKRDGMSNKAIIAFLVKAAITDTGELQEVVEYLDSHPLQ